MENRFVGGDGASFERKQKPGLKKTENEIQEASCSNRKSKTWNGQGLSGHWLHHESSDRLVSFSLASYA